MRRVGHTATLLVDGRVLISGGANASNAFLAVAEVFDPASGAFAPSGELTRVGHTATLLLDSRVLIAGGGDANESVLVAELFH
jgi:hypothetical protein